MKRTELSHLYGCLPRYQLGVQSLYYCCRSAKMVAVRTCAYYKCGQSARPTISRAEALGDADTAGM